MTKDNKDMLELSEKGPLLKDNRTISVTHVPVNEKFILRKELVVIEQPYRKIQSYPDVGRVTTVLTGLTQS